MLLQNHLVIAKASKIVVPDLSCNQLSWVYKGLMQQPCKTGALHRMADADARRILVHHVLLKYAGVVDIKDTACK